MEQSQWLQLFPSSIIPDNVAAFDWGGCGICAFATNSSLHFSFVDGGRIQRLYSMDFRTRTITSISFHPYFRRLAIGDDSGRVIFWDIDLRAAFGSAVLFPSSEAKVLDMRWINNSVLVLYSNSHLAALMHSPSTQTETLVNINPLWDLTLKTQFTKFCVESTNQVNILLSTNQANLGYYQTSSISDCPSLTYEKKEPTKNMLLKEIQWSIHFPHFCFLVFETEISLFYLDSQTLIPLIRSRKNTMMFQQIIQQKDNYQSLIVLHKNGLIAIYENSLQFEAYNLKAEIQPKFSTSSVISMKISFLKEDKILLLIDNLGLGLLDISHFSISAVLPSFPAVITCLDANDGKYTYGLQNGYIIFGCFNSTHPSRFFIKKDAIQSVALTKDKIFWQTQTDVGEICFRSRSVITYHSRVKNALKITATYQGAFAVQREKEIVSIFINGKEIPAIYSEDVVDFDFTKESNSKSGTIAILYANEELVFYPYSEERGIHQPSGRYSIKNDSTSTSLAIQESNICISFSNGSVILFTIGNPNSIRAQTGLKDIKDVSFVDVGAVLGIGENNQLFCIGSKVRICPIPITAFAQAGKDSILALCSDGVVRLIRLKDWQLYTRFSTALAPPPTEQIQRSKILSGENQIFRPEAYDLWDCMSNKPSLHSMNVYCAGEDGSYSKIMKPLYTKLSSHDNQTKFYEAIFADDFSLALSFLLADDPTCSCFMENAAMSGLLVAMEGQQTEALTAHLKSISLSLVLAGKFFNGSVFLRIIRQDKAAADYFIEYGQYEIAKRFVRMLKNHERHDMLVKLAASLYKSGQKKNAMCLFASAKEFHPVLHIAQEMGMVIDSFFIKKNCLANNLLHEMETGFSRTSLDLMDFDTLCAKIDSDFVAFAAKIGIHGDSLSKLLFVNQ